MRVIITAILIALLAYIAGLFWPWWSIAIAAFVGALVVPQTVGSGFMAGFIAIFLLWANLAIFQNLSNSGLLSQKIAQLFPIGGSSFVLILITALIGALVGGFAAMSGSSLRAKAVAR